MGEMIVVGLAVLLGLIVGCFVTILGVLAGKAESSSKAQGAYVGIDRVETDAGIDYAAINKELEAIRDSEYDK